MVIVNLKDGTTYLVDTDSESNARMDIEHKLRDHLDYRKMVSVIQIDAQLDKSSKYYNAICRNSNDLKCKTGWKFKWDK